jgi:hypothetical protein
MRVQQLAAPLMLVAAALFFIVAFTGPTRQPVYVTLGVVFLFLGIARVRRSRRPGPPAA